ncbi:MAG TPA: hypothetical protein VHY58_24885, partial [Streptosporangiaceae bacterium]|nr:hypothetical protein [Streptosporangiaceae bacterium]
MLPTFLASLTGHGLPGLDDTRPIGVDVTAGGGITPAGVAVVLAEDHTLSVETALEEPFVPPDDDFCWTNPDPDLDVLAGLSEEDPQTPASPSPAAWLGETPGCPPGLTEPGSAAPEPRARTSAAPVVPAAWPEGIVPPDGFPPQVPPTVGGPGFGFGQGDPLDTAPPGPGLA